MHPNHQGTMSAIARLVKLTTKASVMNTSRSNITPGYRAFVAEVSRLLPTSKGLSIIAVKDCGATPIERIAGIQERVNKLKGVAGFVIIDQLDELINDPTDEQESINVLELGSLWAQELGAHVAFLNRCNS